MLAGQHSASGAETSSLLAIPCALALRTFEAIHWTVYKHRHAWQHLVEQARLGTSPARLALRRRLARGRPRISR